MNDIPFDLETCREHSLEARQAGIYIHNLFCNDKHEDAMKLIEAVKQRQVGNTFHAILAEVPPCSLRKLINRSPPRMYSEELIVRSFLRQEYDAKARRLMLADQRHWRGLYDATFFNSILPPAQHAPLSAPIFLDCPPHPELQNYLELVKDKLFYKDMLRFVRDYNMFNSKADPMLQLWDDALVDAEYGHLTLLMDEEKAMQNTIRRQLEKDRREGTTKNRYHREDLVKYVGSGKKVIKSQQESKAASDAAWTPADIDTQVKASIDAWRRNKESEKKRVEAGEGQALAVCDNKLFFKISLDAYCGYEIEKKFGFGLGSDFHGQAAVMGGAVLAALTAQRAGGAITALFDPLAEFFSVHSGSGIISNMLANIVSNDDNVVKSLNRYNELRVELMNKLHQFFLSPDSKFKSGDVDLFLARTAVPVFEESKSEKSSSSSSSNNSNNVAEEESSTEVKFVIVENVQKRHYKEPERIFEIAEKNGWEVTALLEANKHIQGLRARSQLEKGTKLFEPRPILPKASNESLKNFAKQGINRLQEDTDGYGKNNGNAGWAFCKTASVLSLYYAPGQSQAIQRWPRMTQLIELDKRAGLIDALLDFDIDAAACMWDGSNVIALPRAIQALATKTLICRPGILQHSRNRARLSKYGRRGFSSRLLDPLCRHTEHLIKTKATKGNGCRHAALCALFKPRTQNPGLSRPTRYILNNNEGLTWSFQACCKVESGDGGKYEKESCCHLKLELIPGDAQHFFASRWKWTAAQIAEVAAQDPKSLWACQWCKGDYRLARFPEIQWGGTEDGDQEAPDDGDLATEVGAMHISSSERFGGDWFVHSNITMYWYGAGVFPKGPSRHGVNYGINEIRGRMTTQARVDQMRYLRDNQSLDGYQNRFVFACSLEEVFQKEERQELRKPTRPPIGLNPERFAIQCVKCEAYVYRAEHLDAGSIVCATCQNYKGSR